MSELPGTVKSTGGSPNFPISDRNGHPLRIATTRAIDECVVTRLEKATMIATIHNEPEFSELFMSYLLTLEQSN